MSYQVDCLYTFEKYLKEQDWDELNKEIARQCFKCGFEYGSLNGAADSIKQYALDRLKPIKNIKAKEIKEIIDKIKFKNA